jgi:hypothetical protein
MGRRGIGAASKTVETAITYLKECKEQRKGKLLLGLAMS